jgi:arginase
MKNLNQRPIKIIGVPMDLGASRRGTDLGPSALRAAGIDSMLRQLGYEVGVQSDISVPSCESRESFGEVSARFRDEIVSVCKDLRDSVEQILDDGDTPIVLGGDHAIAMGTIAGIANHCAAKSKKFGVVWFDAHGDMNTPKSSPSGNIHGMPLAHLLGIDGASKELSTLANHPPALRPENVALVGIRDIDRVEAKLVRESGIHVWTMADIDAKGMPQVVKEVLEVVNVDTDGFHLSFDVDGLDPEVVAGVGTPVPGGVNFREAHYMLEQFAITQRMMSLEIVELNPLLDNCNQGAKIMVHLVASAFGKSIL